MTEPAVAVHPLIFDHLNAPVTAEFDVPPETRCPASMTRNTSGSGPAATPASDFELGCGKAYLRMGNVTERVQLVLATTLLVAVLGTLAINALVVARTPRL
ncbi:hypothetical protein GCM10012280_58080 [Wenjunlia tyrosinilytica]|uniref:Uncharacterized protein n=1 Tax=Wenjunlia tyrosinilytica TaxID=1544741 RepID=A0A918E193_9ACTN|nr:hypothetical protein GCM10012280_58080 [Wenjunlia tyrosinilytica]